MSQTNMINHKLCNQNDMQNDTMKEFEIELENSEQKAKVLLIKQNNKFYCLAPKCSHYQVPLVNGVLYKDRVRCMAHGASFNIKTGDIEDYPGPDCIPKYEVHVDSSNDVYLRATIEELLTSRRIRPVGDSACSAILPEETRPVSANLRAYHELNSSLTKIIPKCLIIGSGAAGLLCLDTLREAGYSSNITMITKESCLPYDRPKLSKALKVKANEIALRDEDFFKSNQINYFTNQEVERINFEMREVYCASGRVFEYDRLVIATGLKSFRAEPKNGLDLNGIFTLRSIEDSNNITSYFDELNSNDSTKKLNVVVVGGSFISMEVVCYFVDKANTTVMARHKPFEKAFGNFVSVKVTKLHESKGVKFHIDNKFDIAEYLESTERPGHLGSIRLKDDSVWPVDLCILAIGSKPVTDFLKNSPLKLTLDNYVYVDKYMRTNIENVYAVGDIAYFPKECLPGFEFTLKKHNRKLDHVNIGHWGLASSQGRVAGLSIINKNLDSLEAKDECLKVVPFFWSAQHGKNIRFAGYNEHYDIIILHEDKTKQNDFKFAAFYLLSNRVIAVCTLDWDPVCALFAEAMYNKIEINKEHIENDPMDIKKLLA